LIFTGDVETMGILIATGQTKNK